MSFMAQAYSSGAQRADTSGWEVVGEADSGEAAAWQEAVRTTDLARPLRRRGVRLLPARSVEDAIHVIKRVQAATPDDVTVSIGLASWDFRESAADLVRRADEALHHAKAGGRDRYVTAAVPA
jgi:GGDEF domain-containing protein